MITRQRVLGYVLKTCLVIKQCVTEPQRAQYGGGIIVNPGFDHNIKDWTVFEHGTIKERTSNDGNTFIVVSNRTQPLDSLSQMVQLEKEMIYIFSGNLCFPFVNDHLMYVTMLFYSLIYFSKTFSNSAWFQVSEGSDTISVVFKINGSELVKGGHVIAKYGCWSLLKGGIVAKFSSPAEILFEVKWFLFLSYLAFISSNFLKYVITWFLLSLLSLHSPIENETDYLNICSALC